MSVISTHNAGFFSCCSVKLSNIVNYINSNLKIPDYVDSSKQFSWYKINETKDITYKYFKHYNDIQVYGTIKLPINFHEWTDQFIDYSKLDYKNIIPLITKYFSPSKQIINIIKYINQKYSINYNNICVLFYRGNDKNRETHICSYDEYIVYANKILQNNSNIKFLIQSDETEFIKKMLYEFPSNSFYFADECRHLAKCDTSVDLYVSTDIPENLAIKLRANKNYKFSKYYLAITIIMSQCKHIICGSGNCSLWIMFYRQNNINVHQFLDGVWYSKME
jgi:hypothetical protein